MTSRSKTEPNPSSVKLMFALAVNRCPVSRGSTNPKSNVFNCPEMLLSVPARLYINSISQFGSSELSHSESLSCRCSKRAFNPLTFWPLERISGRAAKISKSSPSITALKLGKTLI